MVSYRHSSDDPDQISPDPSPLSGFFIHLAGAEPSVFRHLPITETSDFTKLGLTLLIPFILALGAGSFTVYTLLEDKSIGLALGLGLIWAVMVLMMDVAIMSQLMQRNSGDDGPRRASETGGQAQPRKSKSRKRLVLGFLRIGIAATLGVVISHSLVSLIFKDRIEQQLQGMSNAELLKIEEQYRPEITEAEQKINEFRHVQGLSADPEEFLSAYLALTAKWSGKTDSGNGSSKAEDQSKVGAELEPFEKALQSALGYETEKRVAFEQQEEELGRMNRERTLADQARLNESNGTSQKYTWSSKAFLNAGMPTETSDIPSRGPRYETIVRAIENADFIIAAARRRHDQLKEEWELASETVSKYAEEKGAKEREIKLRDDDAYQLHRTARINSAESAKEELKKLIDDAAQESKHLMDQLSRARAPYLKNASSPASHLMALIQELGFGERKEGDAAAVTMVRGLFLIVLLCLMFLDLTPLMMKLMREPGHYEDYISRPVQKSRGQSFRPSGGFGPGPPPKR